MSTPTRAKRMQFGRRLWLQQNVKNGVVFFHIAALSTVLARPIFSAYPNCQTWIRDFLHSEICPREIQIMVPLEPLFVLWSRDGNLDNRSGTWYSPNHFVPLYSTGKGSISSAKENNPEKHQQETITVKPANQRDPSPWTATLAYKV